MSIVKTSVTSYRLTPEQVLQIIAADMGVDPAAIDIDFHVEQRCEGRFESMGRPEFVGCTITESK